MMPRIGEYMQNLVNKTLNLKQVDLSKNVIRARNNVNLADLMQSMKVNGLIHPVTVRKLNSKKYEIVAGHRRFAAAKKLGWKDMKFQVIHVNDIESTVLNVTENLNREDVSLTEAFIAFSQLQKQGLTKKEIAAYVGIPLTQVQQTMDLGKKSILGSFKDNIVFSNQAKQKGKISYASVKNTMNAARKHRLKSKQTKALFKLAEKNLAPSKISIAASAMSSGKTFTQAERLANSKVEISLSFLVDKQKRLAWEQKTGFNFIAEARAAIKASAIGHLVT